MVVCILVLHVQVVVYKIVLKVVRKRALCHVRALVQRHVQEAARWIVLVRQKEVVILVKENARRRALTDAKETVKVVRVLVILVVMMAVIVAARRLAKKPVKNHAREGVEQAVVTRATQAALVLVKVDVKEDVKRRVISPA